MGFTLLNKKIKHCNCFSDFSLRSGCNVKMIITVMNRMRFKQQGGEKKWQNAQKVNVNIVEKNIHSAI